MLRHLLQSLCGLSEQLICPAQPSSDGGKPDSFRLFTSSVCGSEDFQVVERGQSVKFRKLTMVMGALAKSRSTSWRLAQFRSQVRSTMTWFDLPILWFLTTNADSTRRLRNEFPSNHLSQLACIEGVTSDFTLTRRPRSSSHGAGLDS